jgi:hypothetical protein
VVTTYDAALNTLIPLPRFRDAVKRNETEQTHQTKANLISVLQSASRDIENACRRYFIPRLVTLTYDAPPSSLLNLFSDKADELLLNQAQGGPFIKLNGATLSDSSYRFIMNKENTAVSAIEYLRSGIPYQWDTDHRLDGTYRGAIVIRGIRAAAVDVYEDIAQATEMWAVIRWHQKSHNYLDGASGPSEFGYTTPNEVPDIYPLLQRHVRFEGKQIQRVGTD